MLIPTRAGHTAILHQLTDLGSSSEASSPPVPGSRPFTPMLFTWGKGGNGCASGTPTRGDRNGRKEWTSGARRRGDPNRRLKVPSEVIVRAHRPRQENDRELNPQALAAIAEAARRSREARVGPEPRTTRPAEPPRRRPVEESVAPTPDLPSGPQVAMARMQTREAPPLPVDPSAPPTQQRRATERRAVSQTDPVVAARTSPSSGGTRSMGTAAPIEPFGPAGAPSLLEPRVPVRERRERARSDVERRLRWAIGLTAVLLVVVAAAMVGTRSGGGSQASGRTTSTSAGPGAPPAKPSTASTGVSSGGGTTSSPSTPTSAPAEPGGSPALSAVEPSTGYAGQSVTVTGSNFLSSSGQITADVDGQVAPVNCPNPETCTVGIPADPGSNASVPVTITTESGTSNALVFTYRQIDDTGPGGNQGPHPRHARRPTRPVRHSHEPPGQ